MSRSGKSMSEQGLETLSNRLRNTLANDEGDSRVKANKPDFRELDLGSPVSPLRPRTGSAAATITTTSSSSSSSGSVSGRSASGLNPNVPWKSDSNPNSHSGELSAESSPTAARTFKPGHSRSDSYGSHQPTYNTGVGSVCSPATNVLPTGNICPSGRILRTGMASRATKSDTLGSGSGNYGHGSIMRGAFAAKSADTGAANYSLGVMVGEESERKMRACSSIYPEDLKRMGNDSYKKGHFEEALSLYEKAISTSPGNAAYHFNRAAALIGLRRLPEAVKECEEAIKLDPGYARAQHRLGSLLLRLGQVENAKKHIFFQGNHPDPIEMQMLQLVEKHLSKCADSRKVGDWISTLREVDAVIASGVDASPQLFACRAEVFLKLHKLEEAIVAMPDIPSFEHSTSPHLQSKIFGMFFEAYLYFVGAQIELVNGRFDFALAAIEKAGEIDPRNSEISLLLKNIRLVGRARARGNDLFKSERFTEASSAYGEGLRFDPSNAVLYCNRAACWFKLGQWEKSVDDCNKALRIQPHYVKALLRRAASNGKLENWKEAVRDYEVLRKELPHDKEVAESLFHSQVALKISQGEDVHNMQFCGEVEQVLGLEQFRAAISSPCTSVVHFEARSNMQISPFLDTLCSQFPSVNFLKVDIEESPDIARAENVRVVPAFKIYRKGNRVKEMVSPSTEVLESSVRHYSN